MHDDNLLLLKKDYLQRFLRPPDVGAMFTPWLLNLFCVLTASLESFCPFLSQVLSLLSSLAAAQGATISGCGHIWVDILVTFELPLHILDRMWRSCSADIWDSPLFPGPFVGFSHKYSQWKTSAICTGFHRRHRSTSASEAEHLHRGSIYISDMSTE